MILCLLLAAASATADDPSTYSHLQYPVLCGVIGGLGPEATASFFMEGVVHGQNKLFATLQTSALRGDDFAQQHAAVENASLANWTLEEVHRLSTYPTDIRKTQMIDQEHIPLLIYNNPQIPGRPDWILHHNDTNGTHPLDPRPMLLSTARTLVRGGANCLCVICNTAHYFVPYLKANLPNSVNFLNMLELTMATAVRLLPRKGSSVRLGLLATVATINTDIFPHAAAAVSAHLGTSITILSPINATGGNQSAFTEAIFGVKGIKAGYVDQSTAAGQHNFDLLYSQAEVMHEELHVDAVVMGCTEVPLVLTQERVNQRNPQIKLLNPTQVLADEVLHKTLVARKLPTRQTDSEAFI